MTALAVNQPPRTAAAAPASSAAPLRPRPGRTAPLTAGAPPARADVTITATTQALTALIFTGSDTGIDITGETGPVQRFRQLIGTMAAVDTGLDRSRRTAGLDRSRGTGDHAWRDLGLL